jgi:hypothetical protein
MATLFTDTEARMIRDNMPVLSDRPPGVDLVTKLEALYTLVVAAEESTEIALNTTHRGDATGADHSDLVTAIGLNTTHRGDATGADHSDLADHVAGAVDAFHVNRVLVSGALADGTTDGTLQLVTDPTEYSIKGQLYSKAATDDLWDLTGLTDTGAAEFLAVRLYLDASGTATIAEGTPAASAAAAHAALPAVDDDKCQIGEYVAGNSCDFDGVAGLAAQGTIYNGIANL